MIVCVCVFDVCIYCNLLTSKDLNVKPFHFLIAIPLTRNMISRRKSNLRPENLARTAVRSFHRHGGETSKRPLRSGNPRRT